MKQITRLVCVVLCATLFSFSANPGGDSYTIHLNDKLIIQHYVSGKASLPGFSLVESASNDQLLVYYNHCGQIGKSRTISVLDDKNIILKEWRFADVTGDDHTPMAVKAKDILALSRKGNNKVSLLYSSKELPKGRLLASITIGDHAKTARKE